MINSDVIATNEPMNEWTSFLDPGESNDQRALINFRPNEVLGSPQVRRHRTYRRRQVIFGNDSIREHRGKYRKYG